MPHVEVKCYPGRSEEVKEVLAKKIQEDIVEFLGTRASSISVAIKEVNPEDWKKDVWDVSIEPEMDSLYVKPEYKC